MRRPNTQRGQAALCAQLHEEDGKSLRQRHRNADQHAQRRKHAKKRAQLMHQIGQSVAMTLPELSAEHDDLELAGLYVHSVTPAPDASRLRITLCPLIPPTPDEPLDLLATQAKLERCRGALRAAIARDIHRKRTPELELVLLPHPDTK